MIFNDLFVGILVGMLIYHFLLKKMVHSTKYQKLNKFFNKENK